MTMKLEMLNSPALRRLIEEDAIGQLRRHDGHMASLGSEDGVLKLDWVEDIARLLADNTKLEQIEAEAREIWERGIRHIIWAGMGGSIITVRVLAELGFCSDQDGEHIAIYPLDSTDAAALNEIVRNIAWAKDITLSDEQVLSDPPFLRTLLSDVMMIGVSMGMTLPGSYLDLFASEQQVAVFLYNWMVEQVPEGA